MTANHYSNPIEQLEQSLQLSDPPNTPNSPATYALICLHGDPIANIGKQQAGGQSIYVRDLGIALAQRGCQVDIFTRREHPDLAEVIEIHPGCRMIRLSAGPAKFISRTELLEHLPAFVEAWLVFQIKSERNYTLLQSNYWLSGWIEHCARLPLPFRLYLVGGSRTGGKYYQEQQRLPDLVKELGFQNATSFVGTIPTADLPNYYVAANVCFIPSYYEPFGLVALETMVVSNPVVESESGQPIPPRNPTTLAIAIKETLDNPCQPEANGTAGCKWAMANFSSATVTTKINSLNQSLILAESVREALDTQKLAPILATQLQHLPRFKQLDRLQQTAILDRLLQSLRDRHIQLEDTDLN
jgi:D-inositol-3-phosphate glycosyltransferase